MSVFSVTVTYLRAFLRERHELALLGHEIAESTVRKYIDWSGKLSSPTWRTFLKNHAADTAAIDFFTVPSATFRVLFCFIVLEHSRRRLIHFNVTSHPTAEWTGIQIVQAFPYDTAPTYLLRDNDAIYGEAFCDRVEALGIKEVKITPRSPWQNPFAERIIGSIRRECLDHMIILGESHLRRILKEYVRSSCLNAPLGGICRASTDGQQGRVILDFANGMTHFRSCRRRPNSARIRFSIGTGVEIGLTFAACR